ncbi:hypothetical protein AYI69_g2881 [Smittium culicis]|uniref:Uncharacterized protein n=1 Tax=Smittium culicis TaxID=133412 RepID=A0A1R1YL82_9FUNG|nr:hypothetical protein AYI69_g2881 [Smittium culicis]
MTFETSKNPQAAAEVIKTTLLTTKLPNYSNYRLAMTFETSKNPQAAAEVVLEKAESSHDRITLRQKTSSDRETPQRIRSRMVILDP